MSGNSGSYINEEIENQIHIHERMNREHQKHTTQRIMIWNHYENETPETSLSINYTQ